MPWTHDFEHIAIQLADYQRLLQHWQSLIPERILDVSYEQLVENQEDVSRKMIDCCGLEWEAACLEFHKHQRPIRSANEALVRQPITNRSVGRHARYEPYLSDLFDKIGGLTK